MSRVLFDGAVGEGVDEIVTIRTGAMKISNGKAQVGKAKRT